jgi:short-subunit dehydrogenase
MAKRKIDYFNDWSDKRSVLITGASSGLGADYARELAKRGFKIILVARRKDKLTDIADEIKRKFNVETEIIVADLANEDDRKKVVDRIDSGKDVEVLINNAGFGIRGRFFHNPIEKYQELMLVHNTAPVEFTHAAITYMIENKRGVVINMSSLASIIKSPRSGVYCGSKTFLNKFSEILQDEVKEFGIKLQSLCPGMTISEFHSVRDYVGWDRSRVPKRLWMTSKEVVAISLKSLQKSEVTIIPGRRNKRLAWIWNRPFLGKIQMKILRRRRRKSS